MEKKEFHQRRLVALRRALDEQGLDAALICHPRHIFYFTGVMPGPSPAYLLIGSQQVVAVASVSFDDIDRIHYMDYDINHGWNAWDGSTRGLSEAFSRLGFGIKHIGVEANHLPAYAAALVQEHVQDTFDIADILWALRKIKDVLEVATIQINVTINDQMFAAVQKSIRPGMRELELWGRIYETMCVLSDGPFHLEGDIGGGLRGMDLGAQPTNERLQAGDAVFVDIYSAMHGYYADTTRVFVLGEPTQRQREIHKVLEEALAAGEASLKPGTPANQVDAAVRKTVEQAGYGENFPHHSGHAYGLFQQERPFIIPAEPMALEEGMIVTLEPGIYIPGWGGMRIEGNYLIERERARRLDAFPSQLIVCG